MLFFLYTANTVHIRPHSHTHIYTHGRVLAHVHLHALQDLDWTTRLVSSVFAMPRLKALTTEVHVVVLRLLSLLLTLPDIQVNEGWDKRPGVEQSYTDAKVKLQVAMR